MPLHPAIAHVPIALALIMPPFMLAVAFAILRRRLSEKAWLIAPLLSLALSASIYATMYTGSADRILLEDRVPVEVLDAHEKSAESMLLTSLACFLFGVLGIKGRNARVLRIVYLACIFFLASLTYRTMMGGAGIVYGIPAVQTR